MRSRSQDEGRATSNEPAQDRSERATDAAQEQRPSAQEADRDHTDDTEPAAEPGAERPAEPVENAETNPENSPAGEDAKLTGSAQLLENAAKISGELIEFKPVLAGEQAQTAPVKAVLQPGFKTDDGEPLPQRDALNQPQRGVPQVTNGNTENPALTLRLAGTEGGDAAKTDAVPENAGSALVGSGQNVKFNAEPGTTNQNTAGRGDALASSAAGTITQNGAQTNGDSGGNAAGRENTPAFSLPSQESVLSNSESKAFAVEPTIATPTGASQAKGALEARGPILTVANVTDAEAAQNERAIASSVSRGLAAAVQQRGGSLTIRLTPESLGTIKIELELSQGRVAVSLHASNDIAQDALAKNIAMLRSSLESKGLSVERLTVQLTPSVQNSGQASNDQDSGDQSRENEKQDRESSGDGSRGDRDGSQGRDGSKQGFNDRFTEAFGLDADDPRAQTLRLRLSAIA